MNLFDDVPVELSSEQFTDLLSSKSVRIERILSQGQTSPESGWYCQSENEWVLVVQGAATITFEDGTEASLQAGDYLLIESQRKHRVSWTDPNQITLWLAVFFPN